MIVNSIKPYSVTNQNQNQVNFEGLSLNNPATTHVSPKKVMKALALAGMISLAGLGLSACKGGGGGGGDTAVVQPTDPSTPTNPTDPTNPQVTPAQQSMTYIKNMLVNCLGIQPAGAVSANAVGSVSAAAAISAKYSPITGDVISLSYKNYWKDTTALELNTEESTTEKLVYDGTYTSEVGDVTEFKRTVEKTDNGIKVTDNDIPNTSTEYVQSEGYIQTYNINNTNGTKELSWRLYKGDSPNTVVRKNSNTGEIFDTYTNFELITKN